MPRFIVLHLTLADAQVKEINEGAGWSSPAGSVYAALTMSGRDTAETVAGKISRALKLDLYKSVAELETASLAQVFPLTNHIDGNWQDNDAIIAAAPSARSTSVGDLAVRIKDGSAHICASFGWTEITDPEIVAALWDLAVTPG